MTINTKELNQYQLDRYNEAITLSNEVQALGYKVAVVPFDNNRIFKTIISIDNKEFCINKDYKGYYNLFLDIKYPAYDNVSNYKKREIRALDTSNKVKSLNKKKLDNMIYQENLFHETIASLDREYKIKHGEFLKSIEHLPVKYTYGYDKKIDGGEITINGIEFTFKLDTDGYISKDIKIDYTVDDTIENFIALSDNKYNK